MWNLQLKHFINMKYVVTLAGHSLRLRTNHEIVAEYHSDPLRPHKLSGQVGHSTTVSPLTCADKIPRPCYVRLRKGHHRHHRDILPSYQCSFKDFRLYSARKDLEYASHRRPLPQHQHGRLLYPYIQRRVRYNNSCAASKVRLAAADCPQKENWTGVTVCYWPLVRYQTTSKLKYRTDPC